ncbi:MAG TPA: T9SS C-terminal target domain-containing protein, partial [Chryseobacterium sp.]|nr:T9SS C-terminal target domain-containing protein [Chryseobacterium sp.]
NPHGGQKYIAFWSGVPASGVNKNNDWLISPKINLGDTGNQLSFWVKSLASDYGLEKYRVLIYVGEDAPANVSAFTPISGSTALSAPISWTQLNYNLDAYKNQPVRFAINYVSSDVYMMMFDDVKVTATTVLGTNEGAAKKGVRVYPNPSKGVFTLQSAKNVNKVQVFSADGRLVTESKDATQVDLTGKAKGVYMMVITHDDGSTTKQQVIRN